MCITTTIVLLECLIILTIAVLCLFVNIVLCEVKNYKLMRDICNVPEYVYYIIIMFIIIISVSVLTKQCFSMNRILTLHVYTIRIITPFITIPHTHSNYCCNPEVRILPQFFFLRSSFSKIYSKLQKKM